jgi:ribonucleoside-triphosphate reductase
MYKRVFEMKFLPPGRGLWAMGSPLTEERGLFAALNNCAFVSTDNLVEEKYKPFCFLMDASMLGVGVGFDTLGAGKLLVTGPDESVAGWTYQIPDSREGWVEALKLTLDSYFSSRPRIVLDYSQIRKAGEPIRGFGGVSSGPETLQTVINSTIFVSFAH